MTFRTLDQAGDLKGKTALVRVDFNVPTQGGPSSRTVTDDTRLRAALPTIKLLKKKGAKVVLLAHFDRPKGKRVPEMSLQVVVQPLSKLLGEQVAFADDCVGPVAKKAVKALPSGGVLLLENVRYHAGEEANDPDFAKQLAKLADIYVDDAFSAAHRAHASTEGVAKLLPAYAGESMREELEALEKALGSPERPVMGIVGGSKISSKLDLLKHLVTKLDKLAIGGGMANTFLYAQGHDVAPPIARRTWPTPRARSSVWPAATTASCSCRSTSWWPKRWPPAPRRGCAAWARWMRTNASSTRGPRPSSAWAVPWLIPRPWCGTALWAFLRSPPSTRARWLPQKWPASCARRESWWL